MKYAGIINNDVVNGKDVCVSYWCQGCRFRCPGCHNPQTWDFDGGIEEDEDILIEKVITAISLNGIQRNLSILGGEPLCHENSAFTAHLIEKVKERYPTIKVFLWTGFNWEDLLSYCEKQEDIFYILKNVDLLIDGKFDIKNRDITLPFRGSKNQRVICSKESIRDNKFIQYTFED